MAIDIQRGISIPFAEVAFSAVRSPGPGGQNVNKLSTSVELRFDVGRSSLPDWARERVLARADQRLTRDGVIVIRAREYRSQERNREAAVARLRAMIRGALWRPPPRRPTRPGRAQRERRIQSKRQRAQRKALRKPPVD